MKKIEAILLKPLDGREIGSRCEFSKADFDRLKRQGAVKAAAALKNKRAPAPANKAATSAEGAPE